jgi:putative NADH-flavin reductase
MNGPSGTAQVKAKLLLLGATGRTGQELLAQGLELGHEITALVRNPSKLAVEHEHLRVVTGDATDPAAVDRALEGQDAVLCALGPTSPASLLRCELMRETARALVPSMKRHGVSRLVLLSALGVGASAAHAPPLLRIAFQTLLRQVGRDKATAEDLVRGSDIDWTVVYPPSLTDGARTGAYRVGEALELKGVPKISRGDLAEFMLSQLEQPTFSRKIAVVSL